MPDEPEVQVRQTTYAYIRYAMSFSAEQLNQGMYDMFHAPHTNYLREMIYAGQSQSTTNNSNDNKEQET